MLSEAVDALRPLPAFHDVRVTGDPTITVGEAYADSRLVQPGALFCAVPGAITDGHDHARAAVQAGAAALLCERALDLGVPEVIVSSAREAMGPLAAELSGRPAEDLAVVGVTGTNGKTTTIHLIGTVLGAIGESCGLIGTLTGARTTPEAPELQRRLAAMRAEGRSTVAMEVSSHALDLHRVDGTRFRVAVFTNLSRDHLDHHGTMAAYFAAKARLFEPGRCDVAVCNTGDPYGRLLFDAAQVPAVGFHIDDAEDLELRADGATFTWRGVRVEFGLAGRFNVANALAAATALEQLGYRPDQIAAGLSGSGPVPGRFERVDEGQGFLAAVDYAHTPDGLAQVLETARELAGTSRVVVVFGAGGDRDVTKRSDMGEVAARLADVVVLTTDNPRHEDPDEIIAEVRNGMEEPLELAVEPERDRAIAAGVAAAKRGDVLVVAGKGHETTQIIGEQVRTFDDRDVLRAALRSRVEQGSQR